VTICINKVSLAAILFVIAVAVSAAAAHAESGIASIYSPDHRAKDSSAHDGMTAAHRSLPFGTKVRVTNSKNGNSVVVEISDRGPFHHGRVIDLSPKAAKALGINGVAPVTFVVISP
jgi:rare lipoprotein A